MRKKNKLSAHLQYNLWIYIVITLTAITVWTTIFKSLATPAADEQVSILFIGSGLDCSRMENDIYEKIESLTEQNIKKINIEAVETTNKDVVFRLLPTRVYDTDLIILSESVMKNSTWKNYFPSISDKKTNKFDAEYYYEDNLPYGVILDGSGENNFDEFYSGTEKNYVFFSIHSVNLGNLLGDENNNNDAAIAVLKYLLEKNNHV